MKRLGWLIGLHACFLLSALGFCQGTAIHENCLWVDPANKAGWPGQDAGAQINHAFLAAGPRGAVCVATGTYSYSTDIVMPAPGTLICPATHSCVLNYTGTGHAVQVGPNGLTVATFSPDDYMVRGFLFEGGASMAEGIFLNEFVVKAFILDNEFRNFGNGHAFNIWEEGENWDIRINGNYMWSVGQGFNGIYVNAANPANGDAGDHGQSQGVFNNNHIQGCGSAGIGIYANGADLQISDNTISGCAPNILIGAYGNADQIRGNDMEVSQPGVSVPCIQFGDRSGVRVNTFIDGVLLRDNFCNLHNASFKTAAHFIGPSTARSGITNMSMIGNRVVDLAVGQPVVVQNNLPAQTGNNATGTLISSVNHYPLAPVPNGQLHTLGDNITAWSGTDEVFTANGQAIVNGRLLLKRSSVSLGTPYSGVDSDLVLSSGWGSAAAVSDASGYDPSFTFTVTAKGAGIAAEPTIKVTFKDGSWTSAPGCTMQQVGGTGTRQFVDSPTASPTSVVFTWKGTPAAGSTYIFTGTCTGR